MNWAMEGNAFEQIGMQGFAPFAPLPSAEKQSTSQVSRRDDFTIVTATTALLAILSIGDVFLSFSLS